MRLHSNLPRPDTWRVFTHGGGVGDEAQLELYGKPLSTKDRDNPTVVKGLEAATALRDFLLRTHQGSRDALKAAFPQILSAWRLRERAFLLRTPDGKWAPVAHIGPKGFLLLTERMAEQSMKGRELQVPPSGGFTGDGVVAVVFGAVDRGADWITDSINKPVPRALMTIMSVLATVGAFAGVLRRFASK